MPITTIDQSDPYLQQYGGLTVSDDLAAQLAQQQQNANMMGFDAFNGVPVPEAGSSLLDFVAQLHFAGNPQLASDIATTNGIPQQDFTSLIQTVNNATSGDQPYIWDKLSGIGNYSAEHPAVLYAPAIIASALAAAGVGAGAGGVGAAEGGASGTGSISGMLPSGYSGLSSIPGIADMTVTGALPGVGGSLAAGLGGTAAAGLAGSVPTGYSGSPPPGPVDMTVTGTPPAGLGAGALTGIGLGGAAGAAALLGGGSAAAPGGVQGPPETPQGPTQTSGGAAAGAGAGAAAGGLGGLNLSQWLALGGFAADALRGNQDITQNSTSEPPAYLAPYLSDAAGAAQRSFQTGNYVAPIQQSAIDYGQNVLSGSYLNANPWLDQTFNRAAGAVTNQVQSNFGTAGRNVRGPDAAGLATQGYEDLAAQIYGGNYQAERDRMQQIIPQANQLGAVTNPNQSLDDYIARLSQLGGGYGTTSSRIPTQTNWAGGLAGLAALFGG